MKELYMRVLQKVQKSLNYLLKVLINIPIQVDTIFNIAIFKFKANYSAFSRIKLRFWVALSEK